MKKHIIVLIISLITLLTGCSKQNTKDISEETTYSGEIIARIALVGDTDSLNPHFENILNSISENEFDALIVLGDISQGKNAKFFKDFKQYVDSKIEIPYYTIPGDNDRTLDEDGERTLADFEKNIGPKHQIVNFPDIEFILLDSSDDKNGTSDAELKWLEDNLQANQNRKFIAMHIPPIFTDLLYKEGSDIASSFEKFENIINKNQIEAIFAGHLHSYVEFDFGENDVPLYISGGGGSKAQFGDEIFHYLELKIYEEGFTTEVIRVD